MSSASGKRSKDAFYVTVIVLNLAVLGLIGYFMLRTTARAQSEEVKTLGWGDEVPALPPFATLYGEVSELAPAAPEGMTLLFFFPPKALGAVAQAVDQIAAGVVRPELVRAVGVFSGTAADWEVLTPPPDTTLAVVADPDGAVRQSFGLAADERVYTVAVDHEARIRLLINTLVSPPLLLDLMERRAPGTTVRPSGEEPAVAAADETNGLPAELFPSFPGGTPVRRVADAGASRLLAAGDGRVLALSRRDHGFWVLDPGLRPSGHFGGFGQGPGDFIMPYDAARTADGNLLVLDRGNHRIQVVTPDGTFVDQQALLPGAVSVAVCDGEVYVANPRTGSRISRFDLRTGQLRSLVPLREIPELDARIAAAFPAAEDRERFTGGYRAAHNDAYVRCGPDGQLLDLAVWEPVIRSYDRRGELVAEASFATDGLDGAREKAEAEVAEALANRRVVVGLLFQDLAVDGERGEVAVTVTGECPGLILLDPDGGVRHELCLVDETGQAVAPIAVHPHAGGGWLVANELGVYLLDDPEG